MCQDSAKWVICISLVSQPYERGTIIHLFFRPIDCALKMLDGLPMLTHAVGSRGKSISEAP